VENGGGGAGVQPEGDSSAIGKCIECSSGLPLFLPPSLSLDLSLFHRYFIDTRHRRHVGSAGRRCWRILLLGPVKKLPILGHCFERCCSRDEAVSHILVYSAWYRCDKGLDLSVSMIVGHGMYA
jgi:hypothetical protein